VDAEARLDREVVDAVHGCEEPEPLGAQPLERSGNRGGRDDERRLATEEDGVEHRVGVGVAQLLRDQLQPGRVRHSVVRAR
jgi:hypothetical protein